VVRAIPCRGGESPEDTYLVDLDLRGLSVKIRVGRSLEVKMYHGTVSPLDVPGRVGGRIQAGQKWSFPVGRLPVLGGVVVRHHLP